MSDSWAGFFAKHPVICFGINSLHKCNHPEKYLLWPAQSLPWPLCLYEITQQGCLTIYYCFINFISLLFQQSLLSQSGVCDPSQPAKNPNQFANTQTGPFINRPQLNAVCALLVSQLCCQPLAGGTSLSAEGPAGLDTPSEALIYCEWDIKGPMRLRNAAFGKKGKEPTASITKLLPLLPILPSQHGGLLSCFRRVCACSDFFIYLIFHGHMSWDQAV